MFRMLANQSPAFAAGLPISQLAELHPAILEALMERWWNSRLNAAAQPLGHPDHRSDVHGRPDQLLNPLLSFQPPRVPASAGTLNVPGLDAGIIGLGGTRWPHLIYAYMIENTRVLEVFRRVIDMFVHGERMSTLQAASQRWLWTTEELFFRDPPSYSILTLTSGIRQTTASVRANAYQRFFGMTLNPVDGSTPAFVAAEHANADFVQALDEFLHEVALGRQNFANQAGARPTDDAKIAALAERLSDMLRSRRTEGTMSREEFAAVAAMSWFHATLADSGHPIVVDLLAEASSIEERLFKIAQRVGIAAHGLARSYFELAEPLSRLLIDIERGTYNSVNVGAVPALYTPVSGGGGPSDDTDIIVTHWSIIRGRNVKATRVAA